MEIVIRPETNWWKLDFRELWAFRDMMYILSWRDIKVRYKQTALGVVWVLLQPLVSTVIFTIFFGNFVQIPSGKLPYSVFVLLGLIFWNYFSQALNRASFCLVENQQLVTKVYFPREILPIASIVTAFVDFLVSLVLLFGAMVIFQIPPTLLFIVICVLAMITTALASIGLTIPSVAAVCIALNMPIVLGLDIKSIVLLALSVFTVMLSLSKGKSNIVYGVVLLVNLFAFMFLMIYP